MVASTDLYSINEIDQDQYLTLPRVHYPECNHQAWWSSASLPIEVALSSELSRYIKDIREPLLIGNNQWADLVKLVEQELYRSGYQVSLIYPGYRVNKLDIRVDITGPAPEYLPATLSI